MNLTLDDYLVRSLGGLLPREALADSPGSFLPPGDGKGESRSNGSPSAYSGGYTCLACGEAATGFRGPDAFCREHIPPEV